ncbi:hypothetical protein [Flavobacterium tructae]|nr:hypothetical protein [Flavobacterium tructae]
MRGLIDHYIISIYNVENEIKEDLIRRNLKINQDSDEEIDNALNQLFEEF